MTKNTKIIGGVVVVLLLIVGAARDSSDTEPTPVLTKQPATQAEATATPTSEVTEEPTTEPTATIEVTTVPTPVGEVQGISTNDTAKTTKVPKPAPKKVLPTKKSVPAPTKPAQKPSVSCAGNFYNCGDFSNCSQVMTVFNFCPTDVHDLDRDSDGVPCESLCG